MILLTTYVITWAKAFIFLKVLIASYLLAYVGVFCLCLYMATEGSSTNLGSFKDFLKAVAVFAIFVTPFVMLWMYLTPDAYNWVSSFTIILQNS